MKKIDEIFILDNDQPTSCPKCGSRTDFKEETFNNRLIQIHKCLNKKCAKEFIGEFEE